MLRFLNILPFYNCHSLSLFYLPIRDVAFRRVEVDAHLRDWLASQGESLRIVLEVDLVHCHICTLVEFQFYNEEAGGRHHHHVDSASRRMHLYIHRIFRYEREDDVEHLLEVSLRVGLVAIRYRAKESLEQVQGTVHVVLYQALCHAASRVGGIERVRGDVRRNESLGQAYLHLLVWNVEGVVIEVLVIVLDGDIAALIEERHDGGHFFCRGIKLIVGCFDVGKFRRQGVVLSHHVDEIGRRARTKPIRTYLLLGEASEEAEGVEYVG